MSIIPTPEWMNRFRDTVNLDAELKLIGEWFSTDFKLSFEGNDYLLKVRGGRIEEILHAPRFDVPARFSLRAPMSVWRKFINPDPEPLYHDFFAMLMRVPEFEIDGDSLATMQNARALHRMMNILRTMEPFDA
jgi:hypothetical protein